MPPQKNRTKMSKKRQRKIELIQEMIAAGYPRSEVHQKALFFFKMKSEDYQAALEGRSIY